MKAEITGRKLLIGIRTQIKATFVMRPASIGAWLLLLCALLISGVACSGIVIKIQPPRSRYEYNPVWSPDGQLIAFICYDPSSEPNSPFEFHGDIPYRPQSAEICGVNPDGQNRQQLTNNRVEDGNPTWSSDGRQIMFTSGPEHALYVMNRDGSRPHPVSSKNGVFLPAWSPNPTYVAYATFAPGPIRILDLKTDQQRVLTSENADVPVWSPDGKQLAYFTKNGDVCEIHITEVESNTEIAAPIPASCQRIAWSPDSKRLAFVGIRDATHTGEPLFVMTLGVNELLVLKSPESITPFTLVWSPDDRNIYYLGGPASEDELFGSLIDGSAYTRLTNVKGSGLAFWHETNLAVSPDGKQIVFARRDGDFAKLWSIDSDGSNLVSLSR